MFVAIGDLTEVFNAEAHALAAGIDAGSCCSSITRTRVAASDAEMGETGGGVSNRKGLTTRRLEPV